MNAVQSTYEAHAQDVLERALDWKRSGEGVALAVVTETIGGGVRAPGSIMAISETGQSAGYLSGGCIDSDIVLHAKDVIAEGAPESLHYGQGSKFIDLPLPCGGAIFVDIVALTDTRAPQASLDDLKNRKASSLHFASSEPGYTAHFVPKIRLRIAGRGADCLDLARLATSSGFSVHLQLPDPNDVRAAEKIGVSKLEHLTTTETLPPVSDDKWTAFALMFHDRQWETALLSQAVDFPSFYIGAVGSPRTHAIRCDELVRAGIGSHQIARIHGPIGLVPSLRDSSSIAVSTLAEIIAAFQTKTHNIYAESAAVLLAAGASSRYENGDKLLADLNGTPVLEHAASRLGTKRFKSRIAITGSGQTDRQNILRRFHWSVVENISPEKGLSSSLRLGIQTAQAHPDVQSVLVLLADMPFVPDEHIERMYEAFSPGITAVMTESNGQISPPALFSRGCLDALLKAHGDKGARHIFKSLENTIVVPLAPAHALDIDTVQDLNNHQDKRHA